MTPKRLVEAEAKQLLQVCFIHFRTPDPVPNPTPRIYPWGRDCTARPGARRPRDVHARGGPVRRARQDRRARPAAPIRDLQETP